MKFLVVCDAGTCRSVTMTTLLKQQYHEAIAIGRYNTSIKTMRMLCEWADVIVLMQECMRGHIGRSFHEKIHVIDVGPDTYGITLNQELAKKCKEGMSFMFWKLQQEGKL